MRTWGIQIFCDIPYLFETKPAFPLLDDFFYSNYQEVLLYFLNKDGSCSKWPPVSKIIIAEWCKALTGKSLHYSIVTTIHRVLLMFLKVEKVDHE